MGKVHIHYSVNIEVKNDRLKANNVEIKSVAPSTFNVEIQIKNGKMLIVEPKSFAAENPARPVKTHTLAQFIFMAAITREQSMSMKLLCLRILIKLFDYNYCAI